MPNQGVWWHSLIVSCGVHQWVGIFEFFSLNAIWQDLICECISVKIKIIVDCWIRFLILRCWCVTKPSTVLLALAGENQNIMLLLRYRNQRITIVSTPFSSLSIRSWPKMSILGNEWLFVRWVISPLVIHLPVIALTFDTKRKQQNTVARKKPFGNDPRSSSPRSHLFWPSSRRHHT